MSSSEDEYRPGGKSKKVTKSKKNTKPAKPVKDPNKPKQPLSSYMRFVNEKRSEIKEDNPGCGIGEVAKIAGKMWKALEDSEKKVYEKAYEKERKVYLAKMEDYVPPSGTKAPKSKAPKDPNAPKKPLTAYFAWMNQNRSRIKEENPGSSLGEIAKIAGKEWKEVDDEQKSELEATYKEEMEEYREKMKDYVPDKKYQNGKSASKKSSAGSKRKGGKAKSNAEVYDDSSDGEGGASTSSLSDDASNRKKAKHDDSDSD